jgi:pimeloyl-ACP methyl ester carboxylesterase
MKNESRLDFSTLPRVSLPGVELAYIERGQDGPLVLCMHGFPDNATTWLPMLDVLAAQGFRAIAPFTRGYYPSSLAADGDYTVEVLAKDVLALIDYFGKPDAQGCKSAIVIGHDWGGLAAYTAANMAPEKISKLVVSGVPHVHKAPFTLAQFFRSWYILFFQLPCLPEWFVGRNQLRFIDRLYDSWAPEWTASTYHLDSVKASLSAPGALAAALGYYRCMARRTNKARWEVMSRQTTVPAQVFTGLVDGSTGHELFRHTDQCYTALYRLVKMVNVGHFPHLEAPDVFARKVMAFLKEG